MKTMRPVLYFRYLLFIAALVCLSACDSRLPGDSSTSTSQPVAADPDATTPVSVANTGSTAGIGTLDQISANELSYSDDSDDPVNLIYTVTTPPAGGQLELQSAPGIAVTGFPQLAIDTGTLLYRPAAIDMAYDSFTFNVKDRLGNRTPNNQFTIDIIQNVTLVDLIYQNGLVGISWSNPGGNPHFSGVAIRKREDGLYPANPSGSIFVKDTAVTEQRIIDRVSVDISNGPVTHYYTIFSRSHDDVYSNGVNVGLYCDVDGCGKVPPLNELNAVHTLKDADTLRNSLFNAIWLSDSLPAVMPQSIEPATDTRYNNALTQRNIIVDLDYGLSSTMLFHTPFSPLNKLVIYHQGHRGITPAAINDVQRLLQEGYHVLEISMPLSGRNFQQTFSTPFQSHDDFAALDRPMRLFLEPVAAGLNYLMSEFSFTSIYMMGISGGGWTTVVYSALDPRINASYPVAGSYPFYLRNILGESSTGDFEQVDPDFYALVSYIELYIMGAANRRQLQVYNQYDDCCFGGTYSNSFKYFVQDAVDRIGGSFDILIDDTFVGHQISPFALEVILNDMAAESG